ncbi:MAG TPA: fluoride efflux transporter CrcB [Thermoanaerobaculia bacterium]|nr:fluoride efflux transporter CrcB [Thermoanaerobaculia bacterium]
MARLLWICLGGAVGTGARYLLSGWLLRTAGPGFPWGTLAVNVLGSFLLGLIMQVAVATDLLSPTLRLALTTGVMGGFTTYSTFNYETLQYLQQNDWLLGSLNLAVTVAACLAAGALGLVAGRLLAGT